MESENYWWIKNEINNILNLPKGSIIIDTRHFEDFNHELIYRFREIINDYCFHNEIKEIEEEINKIKIPENWEYKYIKGGMNGWVVN